MKTSTVNQILTVKGYVFKIYFRHPPHFYDEMTPAKAKAALPLACVVVASSAEEALRISKFVYPNKIVEAIHSEHHQIMNGENDPEIILISTSELAPLP